MAFTIEVQPAKKVVVATVSGFLKREEAQQYVQELKATINKIANPRDYHLVVNAREQKAVAQDTQDIVSAAIALYLNTPFKSRQSVVFDSAISKTQVERIGSNDIHNQFTFHNSLDAALANCK